MQRRGCFGSRCASRAIASRYGRAAGDYTSDVVGCKSHRALAREVAQKSIVLLKNEGDVLPLADVRRVAVIGALADTPNTGDGGSSDTNPAYVVTPLEGLRAALGEEVEVVYDDGQDPAQAAAVAGDADVAVCIVGYTDRDEGEYISPETFAQLAELFPPPSPEEQAIVEAMNTSMQGSGETGFAEGGDRDALTLRPEDEALIQAVAAANDRTVVAIMAGSAVVTEAWRAQVPALLMLWYPGMEGGNAFADVLLGRVNPSGKLPCTFPRSADDLPFFDKDATAITYDLWHGYRKLDRDGARPAFPFGFGLSYTTFTYDALRVKDDLLSPGDTLVATVAVTNAGDVAGEEVVQLYVAVPASSVPRAPKELKAFARVALAPGQTRTVRLEVPVDDLAYYDEERGWVVEPAEYEVIVARHAADEEALHTRFRVR